MARDLELEFKFNSAMESVRQLDSLVGSRLKEDWIYKDTDALEKLCNTSIEIGKAKYYLGKIEESLNVHDNCIDIRSVQKRQYPMVVTINSYSRVIECTVESKDKFIIKPVQIVQLGKLKGGENINGMLAKLASTGAITLVNAENNIQLVVVNKDVVFESADDAASFMLGERVTNGEDMIYQKFNSN